MNIFVLNRGSSSIKCYLYRLDGPCQDPVNPLWEGRIQWKNKFEAPTLSIINGRGAHYQEAMEAQYADEALKRLMQFLVEGETAPLKRLEEIDVIGHRVVHGGHWFSKSTVVTSEVLEKIGYLADLAPLHNLPELEGIKILEKLLPNRPQVAVFDTAFHHTLPPAAYLYPVPYRWYEEGIRRYGFHGISFQYCIKRAQALVQASRVVICHLGSGASLCAVKDGKSIDTTMGFTPLEGLMMDTRSGSIDPGIILYLLERRKRSVADIVEELYNRSGLLGVSGLSSDMRDIIEKSKEGGRAELALDLYLHRLTALIGSMAASLKGLDALIFTGGIGENATLIRQRVCESFAFLGVKIDTRLNEGAHQEDAILSTLDSQVQVLMIHTQEAFEIASECYRVMES